MAPPPPLPHPTSLCKPTTGFRPGKSYGPGVRVSRFPRSSQSRTVEPPEPLPRQPSLPLQQKPCCLGSDPWWDMMLIDSGHHRFTPWEAGLLQRGNKTPSYLVARSPKASQQSSTLQLITPPGFSVNVVHVLYKCCHAHQVLTLGSDFPGSPSPTLLFTGQEAEAWSSPDSYHMLLP